MISTLCKKVCLRKFERRAISLYNYVQRKKHNEAETPYQRLLNSTYLSDDEKEKLKQTFESLNLAELKRNITKCQSKLFKAC